MSYESGVFQGSCSQDNHAVTLVGFGTDNNTRHDYWLIRNSWSKGWGESGYIRVLVDDSNNHSCFINNEAYLPVV
jgi:cathepsin L